MEAGQGREPGHVASGVEVDYNMYVGPDLGSHEVGYPVCDPGECRGATGFVDEGSVEVDAVGADALPPACPEGGRTYDRNQHNPSSHCGAVDLAEEVLESYRALVLVTVSGSERHQALSILHI